MFYHHSSKTNINLFVQVFPTTEHDWDCLKYDKNKTVLYLKSLYDFHSLLVKEIHPKFWCFKTSGIFLNSCQDEIYERVSDEIINNIHLGIDNVIMSYGQNNAGKTFTMSGLHNQYELRGIIPRFVTDLFKNEGIKDKDFSSQIWISVVEFQKNSIYDLLVFPKMKCKIKDVKKVKLTSQLQCLKLLFKSEAQRKTMEAKFYNSHNASHIVTFTVKLTSLISNEPFNKISNNHFVDLAGVETIERSPATSFKDKDIQGDANTTKTLIEIFALRFRNKADKNNLSITKKMHTITEYLDKAFTSASNVALICHIRPTHDDLKITFSLLKFGMSFLSVPLKKLEKNLEVNYEMKVQNLEEQVKSLQDKLLLLIGNTTEMSPMKISQERIQFIKMSVQLFLEGKISENELLSLVNDAPLILNIMKNIENERRAIENTTVALQTDEVKYATVKKDSTNTTSKDTEITDKIPSLVLEKYVTVEEKKVKTSIKGKNIKNKGEVKSKKGQIPELKSQELQVNLIEPNAKLPEIDSREGLWARFLISRPDIQEHLDKMNAELAETNQILQKQTLAYERMDKTVNQTQLALNQMVSIKNVDSNEMYSSDVKLIVSEDESTLVKELREYQKELEISKHKLTAAQVSWLEALEKLDNKKQAIEEEFKQFCIMNNVLPIVGLSSPKLDIVVDHTEKESRPAKTLLSEDFKEIYKMLQDRYLRKIFPKSPKLTDT